MEALSLNWEEAAHMEPLAARELRHRCVNCKKRGQCALDLADEAADPGWQCWLDYCPNAATLMTLSTLARLQIRAANKATAGQLLGRASFAG